MRGFAHAVGFLQRLGHAYGFYLLILLLTDVYWFACFFVVAEVAEHVKNREIIWAEHRCQTMAQRDLIDFDGVAFITIGRQLMECLYGKGHKSKCSKQE